MVLKGALALISVIQALTADTLTVTALAERSFYIYLFHCCFVFSI